MITKELLQQNIEGLNDDQAEKALEILSNRIGQIHGEYDQQLQKFTGQEKPSGTKTYQWLDQILDNLKNQKPDETITSQLEQLKKENASLQEQIKSGSKDQDLIQKLEQQRDDFKTQFKQLQEKYDQDSQKWASELDNTRFRAVLNQQMQNLKFDPVIPDQVRQTFIETATQKLQSVKREWDQSGNPVFRNDDGTIMTNPENKLNPYTIQDLIQKELDPILDKGREQTGAGTKPNGDGKPAGGSFALDAKTQIQADKQIRDHLMKQGLAVTNPEFDQKHQELREQNNVAELPIR